MAENTKELDKFISRLRFEISNKINERKWSLTKLADEADTDYRSLCMMMKGKHAPNTRTLVKILNALGLELEVHEQC